MRPSIIVAVVLFAISTSVQAEDVSTNTPQISAVPGSLASRPHRQLIHKTELIYPGSITPQNREASIVLRYTIEPDGHVDDIEVVKGDGAAFVREAQRTVSNWIYAPAAEPTMGAVALVQFHAAP
jgi:TonB family protein